MTGRLLSAVALASLLCLCWTENQTCLRSASTCEECIRSGPDCGWCLDSKLPPLCGTAETLQSTLCTHVYNPRGELLIFKNLPADGREVLLEPQDLSITLRPGVSLVFHLRLTVSSDQAEALMLETTTVPEAFNITLRKISTANPANFEITLHADKCPSNNEQNKTGPWTVYVSPYGFSQSTKVRVSLECNCECLNNPKPGSRECRGRGTRVCGQCLCPEPYSGDECRTNNNYCRASPSAPVCSGRGVCSDNFCVCDQLRDAAGTYSGRFCECSNFDCPKHDGRLCAGRGQCECGDCVCDEGWAGELCTCTTDPAPCMAENQMICNGHGNCACGVCRCEPPYMGPTCEDCPTCEDRCQKHMSCAECRVFETTRCDNNCRDLSVNLVDSKEDLPTSRLCKMFSRKDGCAIHFTYSGSSINGQLTVVKTKECPRPMYQ